MCRRVEDGLLHGGRRDVGEGDDRVDGVTRGRIDAAAEHGERVEAVRPNEVPIQRPIRVDGTHDIGLHVAQLNAVADGVARVDRVRQPIAAVVEAELGDVADVHRFAVGEVVEQEIRALGAAGRGVTARGSSAASRGAVRCIARRSGRSFRRRLNREPGRLVAVERVASHAVEFFLLTRREIDQRELVLRRRRLRGAIGRLSSASTAATTAATRTAAPSATVRRRRIHSERRPARVRADRERATPGIRRRATSSATTAATSGVGAADRERELFVVRPRRTNDHVRVTLIRRENVGEPFAVVRQHRRTNGLPRLEICRLQLLGRPADRRGLLGGEYRRGAEQENEDGTKHGDAHGWPPR